MRETMKLFLVGMGSAAVGAVLIASSAAYAADVKPAKRGACLQASRIQNTEIVDSSTILFHMVDGKTWKNVLTRPCTTMSRNDGFIYKPVDDRICSNLETIKIIQSGEMCLLGEFTPTK